MKKEEIEKTFETIIGTLACFNIEADVYGVEVGPTVTRYDIDIARNASAKMAIKRSAEIAMRLKQRDGIRMYENTENGAISVEVLNSKRSSVSLASILKSKEYRNANSSSLMIGLGKSFGNKIICKDLNELTHILVGGVPGYGKTVFLNSLIANLIIAHSPDEVRLMLLGCDFEDRKNEFRFYEGLPHLMMGKIICNQACLRALDWLNDEMERRYKLFDVKAKLGFCVRSIDEFNENLFPCEKKLPKIVVVIDDMTTLIRMDEEGWRERLVLLCQKARGAGIFLVASAHITNKMAREIMDCFPTRIAFHVHEEVASLYLLGESGAEFLVGNGDFLFKTKSMFQSQRIQGANISQDMTAIIEKVKGDYPRSFDVQATEYINEGHPIRKKTCFDSNETMYLNALKTVVMEQSASLSLLQRKCHLSYEDAINAMDWLETMGYVTPYDPTVRQRIVQLKPEDIFPPPQ